MLASLRQPDVRRRVVIVCTVLATLALADAWVHRIDPTLRAYDFDTYNRNIAAIDARPDGDIVLLGSSRVQYGLVPAEFTAVTGLPAYNAGISASKTLEWRLLARKALARHRPALVVLGVNAGEFRADYQPVDAARQLFDPRDFIDSISKYGWSDALLGNLARRKLGPVWAIYDRRFELRLALEERLEAVLPHYAKEARAHRLVVEEYEAADGYEHPWLFGRRLRNLAERLGDKRSDVFVSSVPAFDAKSAAFREFDGLLDWFRAERIPLLVVYVPNSPRTEERWRHLEPTMVAEIHRRCQAHDIAFLNYAPAELPRTDQDYFDELHAGLPLARVLSRRVAGNIVRLGLLDTPRPQLVQSHAPEAGTR